MTSVRVMTYNVRYFGHATRGLTSTEGAIARIADAIVRLDPRPAVIALQEVETYSIRADMGRRKKATHKPQLLRLIDRLHAMLAERDHAERYQAYYYPGHRYSVTKRSAIYTTGLALLCSNSLKIDHRASKRPRDITHRRIDKMKGLKQTRICAHLKLTHRKTGVSFDIFNTHLSLPAFLNWRSIAFTQRMGHGENQVVEADSILEFIEHARTSDRVLLVGDFNALPGTPVYKKIMEVGGFIDPFSDHKGLSIIESRDYATAGFMNLRMHLDHVFSTPEVEWLDFDETHPYGSGQFRGLSDHMPLIGRLKLSED